MKLLGITTAILAATLALAACKNRKEEPIPGPKAAHPAAEAIQPAATPDQSGAAHSGGSRRHGASGISWFQGTLDEAFSTTCGKCTAMFWREAMDTALDR
ncbi:MAG TPA: hypothetical protein VI653_00850 [Steroidobacteraceae bacterium]